MVKDETAIDNGRCLVKGLKGRDKGRGRNSAAGVQYKARPASLHLALRLILWACRDESGMLDSLCASCPPSTFDFAPHLGKLAGTIELGSKSSSRKIVLISLHARDAYTKMPEPKHDKFPNKDPPAEVVEQKAKKAGKRDADRAENIERGEKLLALLNIR